jgi:general secretion pathway protein G
MSARRTLKSGFTLVEILIVVVILGILAAVVIPQFTSASENARASSLVSQLQTIRSQLELAQIEHEGVYPAITLGDNDPAAWAELTSKSDPSSTLAGDYATATGGPDEVGPYLQKAPANPFASTGNQTVVEAFGSAGADVGWVYDQTDGRIKASIDYDKAVAVNLIDDAIYTAAGADHPDFELY